MKTTKMMFGLASITICLLLGCGVEPGLTAPAHGDAAVWSYNANTNKCYTLVLVEKNFNGEHGQRFRKELREFDTEYVVWVGNGIERADNQEADIAYSRAVSHCGSMRYGDLASYEGVFKTSKQWDTVYQPLFREKAESDACMTFNGVGETEHERGRSTRVLTKNRACEASYMYISGRMWDQVDMVEGFPQWTWVWRQMVYDSQSKAMAGDLKAIRALIVQALQEGKPTDAKSKAYRESHDLSEAIFAE